MEDKILYSDNDVAVVIKPRGALSEDAEGGVPRLLAEKLGRLYPVHRLDRGVGGVMVYARHACAAAALFHDAPEILTGDLPTPVKYYNPGIRDAYQRVENICHIEDSRKAYAIIEFIYRNHREPLSARDVATRFGITVSELNRLLLIQVERNFEDFLHWTRINKACELLLEGIKTLRK